MKAVPKVWIMFRIRSSIFLCKNEPIPFLLFPNLAAHSIHSLKGSVSVEHQSTFWQETRNPAWWQSVPWPFPKGEGKPLHLRCTSGNQCSPSSCSGSCKCQMSKAPILSVLDLLNFSWDCWETVAPLALCAPRIQQQAALGLYSVLFCRREPKNAANWSSFFKRREELICESCPFSISCCLPVCLEGKTDCGCASN